MTIKETQGDIVIMSGATGFLGSVIAKTLASNGLRVAVLYRIKHGAESDLSAKEADNLIDSLDGTGHRAYACDLAKRDSVDIVMKQIESELGKPRICIHCAWGKLRRAQLISASAEDVMASLEANIPGSFNLLAACASYFKHERQGTLIGITTSGVIVPEAAGNMGSYIPAKYALQGILTAFRTELASAGVRVYSIAPDFMDGGMNSDIPKAFVEMIRNKNPGKSLVGPQDVADRVMRLCSGSEGIPEDFTQLIAPSGTIR